MDNLHGLFPVLISGAWLCNYPEEGIQLFSSVLSLSLYSFRNSTEVLHETLYMTVCFWPQGCDISQSNGMLKEE